LADNRAGAARCRAVRGRGLDNSKNEETCLRALENLAKLCAILAGVMLTVITLMTCVSLIGRNVFGATLAGDFELTGVAAGAAIALFMPWCQLRRGNIIVDFFTAKASERTNARLDRFGAFLLSATMALLAWRAVLGGLNAYDTHSGTMMLGFPEWVVYAAMVPPLVLTAVIALAQAVRGFETAEAA
jgi:TRAP-type C4-dicarboxylate transport system permease small subunit